MEYTETVYTIQEALALYPKNVKRNDYTELLPSIPFNSPNLKWNKWEQSYKAAKNTLEYIIRLKTKVYLLIIEDHKFKNFVKFNPRGINKELMKYINKKDPNVLWTKKDIEKLKNTKWKFMACILQDRPDEDVNELHPYHKGLKQITEKYEFPDGMYVFSLRDVVLIHKEKIHPWINITGEKFPLKNYPSKFLPVFNTTGGLDYWDIPIPTFEDRNYIFKNKPDLTNVNLVWENKISTAIFRGSASGCGYNDKTNQRIKISKISQTLQDSKDRETKTLLNAGLSKISKGKKYRFFDGKIGYFDNSKTKLKEVQPMDKITQSNYKYIVYVEGNVAAHRLGVDMLLGSTILYVESQYTLWFSHLLQEYVHYVPVKSDLSDLIEKIKWCRKNDGLCQTIAQNARKLALELLNRDVFDNIFINYIRYFGNSIENEENIGNIPEVHKDIVFNDMNYYMSKNYLTEKFLINDTLKNIFKTGKIQLLDDEVIDISPNITPKEGLLIYDIVKNNKFNRCLEIGMTNGISSMYICEALKNNDLNNSVLFSIDPLQITKWKNSGNDNLVKSNLQTYSVFIDNPAYEVLPNVLALIQNGEISYFDFIFIDGMYIDENILEEFFYCDLVLRNGGVIVIDYCNGKIGRKLQNYIVKNYNNYKRYDFETFEETVIYSKI